MIVIKNVFGGSTVYIKSIYNDVETVIVYNGGTPIEITGGGGGSGDVVGPASATDNAIVRFNLTTGKLIQNSGATIDDSGNITATNLSGTNTGDQDLSGYEPLRGADDNYVTDAEKIVIGNTSGTNTGDQDLSGYALTSHTHAQSAITNLTTDLSDIRSGGLIKSLQALGSSLKGWNPFAPLDQLGLTYTPADGRQFAGFIYVPEATTITGLSYFIGTNGNFTGDQTNSIALYSYSSGTMTKVAETANSENIWKRGANSFNKEPLTAPYAAAGGIYFVVGLWNASASTTAPTIYSAAPGLNSISFTMDFTNSAKLGWFLSAQNSHSSTIAMSATSVLTSKIGFGYY